MKVSSLRNFVLTTKCKSANNRRYPLHKPAPHDWENLKFAYRFCRIAREMIIYNCRTIKND